MTITRGAAWCGVWLGVAAMANVRGGSALQRTGTPATQMSVPDATGRPASGMGNAEDFSLDAMTRKGLEEKRGKLMNSERQRLMVKEANQLVQTTAELQASVEQGSQGAARDEALRRADTIEKLAHNVKERMKGAR